MALTLGSQFLFYMNLQPQGWRRAKLWGVLEIWELGREVFS